jgi:hypothetical protein
MEVCCPKAKVDEHGIYVPPWYADLDQEWCWFNGRATAIADCPVQDVEDLMCYDADSAEIACPDGTWDPLAHKQWTFGPITTCMYNDVLTPLEECPPEASEIDGFTRWTTFTWEDTPTDYQDFRHDRGTWDAETSTWTVCDPEEDDMNLGFEGCYI